MLFFVFCILDSSFFLGIFSSADKNEPVFPIFPTSFLEEIFPHVLVENIEIAVLVFLLRLKYSFLFFENSPKCTFLS